MRELHYALLNPSGNLTALVTDPILPEEEGKITRALLAVSEQVAYLEAPTMPGAEAAIRLMGGEFCGNASMAAAAWLVRDRLKEGMEAHVPLQVSGAGAPVVCLVRRLPDGFLGTVGMPPILEIREAEVDGRTLTSVRMEGILHLIAREPFAGPGEAEAFLRRIAASVPDDAVGLLQWNREAGELSPLVFVRGSGSLVWEHGCGSGSAAVGAVEALSRGDGVTVASVHQPGGTITVTAAVRDACVSSVSITGVIHLPERETTVPLPSSGDPNPSSRP